MENKERLAKLLATENISVRVARLPTAAFHPQDRVLYLPNWDENHPYVIPETIDHLTGHEVGHALFTSAEGWHDVVLPQGRVFKEYCNVIEDIRIEKLVQRKFPGLRRSFIKSANNMFANGFFGETTVEEVNAKMNLIDRINIHFKCGVSLGVKFSEEEMPFIERANKLETWEEVLSLVEDLIAFTKEQMEKEPKDPKDSGGESQEQDKGDEQESEASDSSSGGDDEDQKDGESDKGDSSETSKDEDAGDADKDADDDSSSGSGAEGDEDDNDGLTSGDDDLADEDDDGTSDDSGEEDADASNIESEEYGDHEGGGEAGDADSVGSDYLESKTDREFREKEQGLIDTSNNVIDVDVPVVNPNIHPYKKVVDVTKNYMTNIKSNYYSNFKKANRASIDYLVKEFEMRKQAEAFRRTSVSKTGVLDTLKMNNYKFSEDVFMKKTTVQEGKNHGFIFFIDWSGSMASDIYDTICQMLRILLFCRKVGVAYRVYAFSDAFVYEDPVFENNKPNTVRIDDHTLIEFFHEKMSASEFDVVASYLLHTVKKSRYYNPHFQLGATPLNDCIMVAREVHDRFKRETQSDIVNTIFLTDGGSNYTSYLNENGNERQLQGRNGDTVIVRDPRTKLFAKSSPGEFGNVMNNGVTSLLLRLYREVTGSRTINFFLTSGIAGSHIDDKGKIVKVATKTDEFASRRDRFRKEGYEAIDNANGYDRFFSINKDSLKIKANQRIVGITTEQLAESFMRGRKSSTFSRKMLDEIIEMIA